MTRSSIIVTRIIILILLLCAPAAAALGQEAKISLDSLAPLEAKAAKTVDVALDENMLKLAAKVLSGKRSSDEAKIKELIAGLKGVYVKVLEFDRGDEYTAADLDAIRAQLRSPQWTRLVGVRTRRGGENVEVFVTTDAADKITGLTIIAAERRELVVVNITGMIDLEKLSELEGNFGIPQLEIKIKD
jgi:hypothetical protein